MANITVSPTRMELTRLKGKLRTAQRGHKLLKDKRDELMKQFLDTVREVRALRAEVEEELMKVHNSFTVASALMSSEALEQALATLEKTDTHSIMVQHYQNYTRILHKDILYVQKMQRSIQIVTDRQGNFKDNRGIKELFSEIDDPRFIFTDRAYFVNLDYVQELDGSWLVLNNEDRVPISRPMMPNVKKAMIALWGGNKKK